MQRLLRWSEIILKKYKLDIPGTAYFDEGLDRLSDHYGNDGCKYYVIEDDHGQVIGGGKSCESTEKSLRTVPVDLRKLGYQKTLKELEPLPDGKALLRLDYRYGEVNG